MLFSHSQNLCDHPEELQLTARKTPFCNQIYSQVFIIKENLIIQDQCGNLTTGQVKEILQETTLIGTQVTQSFINGLLTDLIKTLSWIIDEQVLQEILFQSHISLSKMVNLSSDEN